MKNLFILITCLFALALNSHSWPENEMGTIATPSLNFKTGTVKTFVSPGGGKYLTFEAVQSSNGSDFTDGSYSSFVVDYTYANIVLGIMTAQSTGRSFKIDYVKDSSFMNRPVMVIKVFTFVN